MFDETSLQKYPESFSFILYSQRNKLCICQMSWTCFKRAAIYDSSDVCLWNVPQSESPRKWMIFWLSYTKNNYIIKIYTSYFWITIENLTCFFIRHTQQVNKYFFYNLFTYVYSVNTVLFFFSFSFLEKCIDR